LIQAALVDTGVMTTPTLLAVLTKHDDLAHGDARRLLDRITEGRSWASNSYVQRARSLLEPD
jgi:hypothetical protein